MTVCVYVLSVSFPHLFFSLYKDLFVFGRAESQCCLGLSLLAGSGATLSLRCVASFAVLASLAGPRLQGALASVFAPVGSADAVLGL